MKAIVKTARGKGNVELQDVPEPVSGEHQVKVRVMSSGWCASDTHILNDDILLNIRTPVILGHEFSGVVAEVGQGVERIKVGQRVSSETTFHSCGKCRNCLNDVYSLCPDKELIGYVHAGCFAPYIIVPQHRVHVLPDNLSFDEAALLEPLACCYHALYETDPYCHNLRGRITIAGAGTIGLLCLQLAKHRDVPVYTSTHDDVFTSKVDKKSVGDDTYITVFDPHQERRFLADDLGADDVKDPYRGGVDYPECDVFIECSGNPAATMTGLKSLRKGGVFYQVGLGHDGDIDWYQVAYKELRVYGSLGSRHSSWIAAIDLARRKKVRLLPLIGKIYSLDEWQKAINAAKERRGVKILFHPNED